MQLTSQNYLTRSVILLRTQPLLIPQGITPQSGVFP